MVGKAGAAPATSEGITLGALLMSYSPGRDVNADQDRKRHEPTKQRPGAPLWSRTTDLSDHYSERSGH